jgi:hypothetical protein
MAPSRVIQFSQLGSFGRFGNQLFQYCYSKAYAEKHHCILQVPKNWIGRRIFNIDCPPINKKLRQIKSDSDPRGQVNIDLLGYFQAKKDLLQYSREDVRRWLVFQPDIIKNFQKPFDSYVACHIRHGDYLSNKVFKSIYCSVSKKSYELAIKKFGYSNRNIVYISEEKPIRNSYFEKLGIGFLEDFLTLCNADVLFRANSTFSWWASVLSANENQKIYSPLVGSKIGLCDVDFASGNYHKIYDPCNNNDVKIDSGEMLLKGEGRV